jgi:endonuclease/exonuclease/phosphatase family metal-dependent hydrolase
MTRFLARVTAGLILVAPLAVVPATASAAPAPARELTVMSRNLYLGADLNPAAQATSIPALLGAVATIYGHVLFTDFPARAGALAAEIDAADPDLIGLQEVSLWSVTGPTPAPGLDFLAILQAQLAARGLSYAVAATSWNADIGPLPLVAPCGGEIGACTIRMQDRDVVLVRTSTPGLTVGNPRSGDYAAQVVVSSPTGPLSFARGWATVDGTYAGARFRFAVTHLEVEGAGPIQVAQGQEFLQVVKAPGAVIAVGDFNSAADGSQTATYGVLTADYFRDAWWAGSGAGLTCCQDELLSNATSELATRIDLVLTHAFHPLDAQVVGATAFRATPPWYASDHAGVVARVRLH